ncbi:hypothetical protein GCM10017673_35870 [Streptosporangium violaceochromogenes]|nr:hypothetical protein GCM10017673_35870 [Streptosporangium violaceochromogenes]
MSEELLFAERSDETLVGGYRIRSSARVDLNRFQLRISSNLDDFSGYSYFTRFIPDGEAGPGPAYRLFCVDLDRDDVDMGALLPLVDRTYRAERFRSGFYLAHHFGPPAYLVTRGNTIHVFGRQLERTVWPYFVKHLLTIFGVDHDMLHLKAAAFEQPGAGATLLFGRGSAGKTVFLTRACLAGAGFLANTHVLTRGDVVYGVASAMRVRRDRCFADLIESGRLPPHLEEGEFRLDPAAVFDGGSGLEARVRNLCVIDFQGDRRPRFTTLDTETFLGFIEQFALAIPTYGLKDDVLAHVGMDFDRFMAVYNAMKERMRRLVETSHRYYINVNMFDPETRDFVMDVLAGRRSLDERR